MNIKLSGNNYSSGVWLVATLLAAFFPMASLRAQAADPAGPGRYLFIFDTSSNMKRCEPAVEKSLEMMLVTSMNGQMHKGDTFGVWTFNQDLHPGDYPLQVWNPENAANIASNLIQFVQSRKYENKTRFEALQPLLNRVMQSSERLTVLIFSDGQTKITGTTYDTGINQLFATNAAAQKKAREPVVVVLRSQQGKYVGCAVTFPPQMVGLPDFPPLPEPPPPPKPEPKPVAKPEPEPEPVPTIIGPPLIIKGTNVVSSLPAAMNPPPMEPAPTAIAPTNAPVVPLANPPPAESLVAPVLPSRPTNPPAVAEANPPAPTNELVAHPPENPVAPVSAPKPGLPASPVAPANVQASVPTNTPAVAATETPKAGGKKLLLIGVILFAVAAGLAALAVFYFRRPDQRSLISDSMKDK